VLWFAGHSSVGAALKDPMGALTNNCVSLLSLRRTMRSDAILVYASTGSLYSRPAPVEVTGPTIEACEDDRIIADTNSYDISKFCFDYMAKGFLSKYIGLRLGTVSGYSPNLRPELIFNAMNISAIREKRIRVANPNASRSILFLSDLYKVISRCISDAALTSGFYNIASCTRTVGEFAQTIAEFYKVPTEPLPDTPTYSFRLSTEKAQQTFRMAFDDDIAGHCATFLKSLPQELNR
jgi:nucleoside-diphosphate-sugar epimerase